MQSKALLDIIRKIRPHLQDEPPDIFDQAMQEHPNPTQARMILDIMRTEQNDILAATMICEAFYDQRENSTG